MSNPLRQNKLLDAQKAFELGFADRLLDPVEFVDESIAYALELVETPLVRAAPDYGDIEKAMRKGRSQADDAVHGATRAPYVALDLIEGAVNGWSLQEGYRAEEEAIADLMISPRRAGRSTPSISSSAARRGASVSPTRSRGASRRSASSAPA